MTVSSMGASATEGDQLPWFRQLARQTSVLKEVGNVMAPRCLGLPIKTADVTKEWPAFDLADVMEGGHAHELTTHFTEVESDPTRTREFTVSRSEDMREQVLLGDDNQPLLIARKSSTDHRRIDILVAGDGGVPVALGPAFSLTHSEDHMEWELRSTSCESCEYYMSPTSRKRPERNEGRSLMVVRHDRIEIGRGAAMAKELTMPKEGEVWCECCGDGGRCSPRARDRFAENAGRVLASRRPKWCPRQSSLTLDFKGRCNKPSSKNFQLVNAEICENATIKDVDLQFGKMRPNAFCLDFRNIGTVQAFAAALSTSYWK
jgi:hypothetical protein